MHTKFRLKNLDHLKDLGVDGKIILKYIHKDVDWIHLLQDKNQWHAVVTL
jgi:hypothetical protein